MKGGGGCLSAFDKSQKFNSIVPENYAVITLDRSGTTASGTTPRNAAVTELGNAPRNASGNTPRNASGNTLGNAAVSTSTHDVVVEWSQVKNIIYSFKKDNILVSKLTQTIFDNVVNKANADANVQHNAENILAMMPDLVLLKIASNFARDKALGDDKTYDAFAKTCTAFNEVMKYEYIKNQVFKEIEERDTKLLEGCQKFVNKLITVIDNLLSFDFLQLQITSIITYSTTSNEFLYITDFPVSIDKHYKGIGTYEIDISSNDAKSNISTIENINNIKTWLKSEAPVFFQKSLVRILNNKDTQISVEDKKENETFETSVSVNFYITIFDCDIGRNAQIDATLNAMNQPVPIENVETIKTFFMDKKIQIRQEQKDAFKKARNIGEILDVIGLVINWSNGKNCICIKTVKSPQNAAAPSPSAGGNKSRTPKPIFFEKQVIDGRERNVYKLKQKLYIKRGNQYISLKEFEKEMKKKVKTALK